MSEIDKMRDEMKKASSSKKMKEELDKMRPNEVVSLYYRLQFQGKKK